MKETPKDSWDTYMDAMNERLAIAQEKRKKEDLNHCIISAIMVGFGVGSMIWGIINGMTFSPILQAALTVYWGFQLHEAYNTCFKNLER